MSTTIALIALVCRHSEGIALATGVDENTLLDRALAAKAEHDQLRLAACTPAERAVLDAMANGPSDSFLADMANSGPMVLRPVFRAELARRGGGC